MFIILKKDWDVRDGSDPTKVHIRVKIPAGRHEFERVQNPFNHSNTSAWLVLKGTLKGFPEEAWRSYVGSRWNEWEVKIEE